MLVRRSDAMPGVPVEMDGAKNVTMRMMVGRGDGAPNFAMRHFTVEPGGHSPKHSHNYEHEVFIVKGRGVAECAGAEREIRAGDALFIEPNALHQFRSAADEALEFICLVPNAFDCSGASEPTPGSG